MEWILENLSPVLLGGAAILLILFYIRQRKRIRCFLLGSISGIASLVLLHFFGDAIGYAPTLCLFNLAVAAFLGVPGVILLYLAEIFFT